MSHKLDWYVNQEPRSIRSMYIIVITFHFYFVDVGLFGIAMPMLHDLNSQKCNNHLVSFIKVEGLFFPYIVDIFDAIKSEMTV